MTTNVRLFPVKFNLGWARAEHGESREDLERRVRHQWKFGGGEQLFFGSPREAWDAKPARVAQLA